MFNSCSVHTIICQFALYFLRHLGNQASVCVCLGNIKSLRGRWFNCETRPQLNGRLDLASACFVFVLLGREKGRGKEMHGNMTHKKHL